MRTLILTLATVLALGGIGRADDKATELVKKAIDAHGGADALNKYKAGRLNMNGEFALGGMSFKFTGKLSYSTPDRFKMEMNAKVAGMNLVINQTVNGKNIKNTVTLDGMKQPGGNGSDEDELRFAAALQEVGLLTPLLDAKKFEIKALDDTEFDGVKYSGIEVKVLALKKDCKLYFDKKTGLQTITVHQAKAANETGGMDDVKEETFGSDFKKINGVLVPMKLLVNHDGKKFMEINCKDYELLESIDAKEFAIDD
ncbi:hypothetical protein [Zavarzinella formosa]|uniref:hypothetical protein n=1 Tax=Zavarzinella formosa TaxID=360055 RepID=UPI0002E991B8|nr:hypothetical protein [Zavarzinella formosa]